MAVMTSQPSDGVAFEQKIHPVPSSDKMALDLDINGNSNRDETNLDITSPDITLTTKAVDLAPLNDDIDVEVNGAQNSLAFTSNETITSDVDITIESQATETSPISAMNSSQLPDTNTTTTEVQLSTSPEVPNPEASTFIASSESVIESAVEDVSASTTVPPIIEAPESDLRNVASPLALVQPVQESTEELPSDLDLGIESDLPEVAVLSTGAEVNKSGSDPSPNALPQLSESDAPQEPTTDLDLSNAIKSELQAFPLETAGMDFNDTDMVDAPLASSTKVAREREEDDDDVMEPSAKRTKTEDESLQPDAPVAPTQNGESSTHEPSTITPYESKEIIKILKNVARTQSGKNFRAPVQQLWPNFADQYAAKISNEVDLQTMEKKLREGNYRNIDDFKIDVELVHDNAVTFNGPDHQISKAGLEVRDAILTKIASIPPEPAPLPKKEKKARRSTPNPELAPRTARRPSRGAHITATTAAPAPPPVAAAPPPTPAASAPGTTFALDPTTSTPLIRRDSTKIDGGRPKREIHPPKNKDLVYTVRPKSKKHATELKFCKEVLNELQKPKHAAYSNPFMIPVDPVALNIPNYFTIIKKPMDISTVAKKLDEGAYSTAADFEKDVKLIFFNCFKFNPGGNPVNVMGHQLQNVFNEIWAKKDQWIAEHTPTVASPTEAPDTEEEESEEEQPESSTLSTARDRLVEEQQKLISLMQAKVPDPAMISMQQEMINVVQNQVEALKEASKKKSKKPKAPKAPKKAVAPKKSAAASKKGGSTRQRYLGTLEKETISNGLMSLPDDVSGTVLEMIKRDQPGVDVGDDGTLELDIDLITVPTLWKIHALIMQYAPEVEQQLRKQLQERESPRTVAKPPPKKKNKPMSKSEQERKITELSAKVEEFERQSSGSQEPVMRTVETNDETSGDEESDSEEE